MKKSPEDRRRIALGQHYLVDERIISQIVKNLEIKENEVVLELGAGTGKITRQICEFSGIVHSYEIDPDLFKSACTNCQDRSNVYLYNLNLLGTEPVEFDVFFSNLPYSCSKEVIRWLSNHKFKRGLIMVQDEFASKMFSQPGQKNFSVISVISQYCFKLKMIATVHPEAFIPPPKVTSKLIHLTQKNLLTLGELRYIELMFRNKKKIFDGSNRNFDTVVFEGLLKDSLMNY
jgi:16S rRNA (adenine1518-N6/adenine1519-N6)-dimethyltransferase